MAGHILTINGGSSSIKFALFPMRGERALSGLVERIGMADAQLHVKERDEDRSFDQRINAPDHAPAVERLIDWLKERIGLDAIAAIPGASDSNG